MSLKGNGVIGENHLAIDTHRVSAAAPVARKHNLSPEAPSFPTPLFAGIRREDKNKWERRVPLSPDHVKQLVAQGVRVLIQPSNIRIFPNEAYAEAGADVVEDLSPASTILAVKEVPMHLLVPERTYLFFSHTIKAQPYNMPLLDALLDQKIRMVDYECITQGGVRGGRRLVAFGRFAGIAGMVDFLRGCGERFLSMGYSTPFLNVAAMYMYPDVAAAKAAVKACGEAIAKYGLPEDLCPFTAVFTGDGNVSKGAQEIFDLLPVKWVDPNELRDIKHGAKSRERTHCVFGAVATERHMVRLRPAAAAAAEPTLSSGAAAAAGAGAPSTPLAALLARSSAGGAAAASAAAGAAAGGATPIFSPTSAAAETMWLEPTAGFDKGHYKADPDAYEPIFHVNVLPFTSVLINCMYWEPRFPRLVSVKQAKALKAAGSLPLLGVCDISCDFQGSVEFLKVRQYKLAGWLRRGCCPRARRPVRESPRERVDAPPARGAVSVLLSARLRAASVGAAAARERRPPVAAGFPYRAPPFQTSELILVSSLCPSSPLSPPPSPLTAGVHLHREALRRVRGGGRPRAARHGGAGHPLPRGGPPALRVPARRVGALRLLPAAAAARARLLRRLQALRGADGHAGGAAGGGRLRPRRTDAQ